MTRSGVSFILFTVVSKVLVTSGKWGGLSNIDLQLKY